MLLQPALLFVLCCWTAWQCNGSNGNPSPGGQAGCWGPVKLKAARQNLQTSLNLTCTFCRCTGAQIGACRRSRRGDGCVSSGGLRGVRRARCQFRRHGRGNPPLCPNAAATDAVPCCACCGVRGRPLLGELTPNHACLCISHMFRLTRCTTTWILRAQWMKGRCSSVENYRGSREYT